MRRLVSHHHRLAGPLDTSRGIASTSPGGRVVSSSPTSAPASVPPSPLNRRREQQLARCRRAPFLSTERLPFGWCASAAVAFRSTRVLLRPDRKGPATPMEIADALCADTVTKLGTNPLELNLFEDPTGGLASGPAEELSTTEIEAQVRLLVSGYSQPVYYLLYTPFVDIVQILVEKDLLPQSAECRAGTDEEGGGGGGGGGGRRAPRRPEEVMSRWFSDGVAVLKNPQATTVEAMGERRWRLLSAALGQFYAPIEEVMPLTRVVRRRGLPESIYVPFLRRLAMNLVEPDSRKAAVSMLPGLILGLANGRAPVVLELPEDHDTRVRLVAELFLGVAHETGSADLAYLGIQLLRANDIMPPFTFQKQLTNVFSAAARLQTDWQTRSTGQLVDTYHRWLAYYKVVRLDNARALGRMRGSDGTGETTGDGPATTTTTATATPTGPGSEMTDRSVAGSSDDHEDDDGDDGTGDAAGQHGQHEYFTSRLAEDVERIAALERNVDAALLSRAPALEAEVAAQQRRRSQRGGTGGGDAPGADGNAALLAGDDGTARPRAQDPPPPAKKKQSRGSPTATRKKSRRDAHPVRVKSEAYAAAEELEEFEV